MLPQLSSCFRLRSASPCILLALLYCTSALPPPPPPVQDLVIELDRGQFFGEAALMASCSPPPHLEGAEEEEIRQWRATRRKRTADVEAVQFCYLFVLTASDFGKVWGVVVCGVGQRGVGGGGGF